MEFERKTGGVALTIAVTIASTALIWFGTGLEPLWPLLWLAPFPTLLVCLDKRPWPGLAATALAWFVGTFSFWAYFRHLQLPPAAFLVIAGAICAAMTLAALLFRILVRKGAVWIGLLAFPAVVVSFEYLRNISTPHGTAGSLAYTQLHFLPFLQLASVTGPWGMTFLLMLLPASLAIAAHLRRVRVLVVSCALLAVVLIFGLMRLAVSGSGQKVSIGLIASDAETGVAAGNNANDLLARYATAAHRLAAQGARIIVLPEKLAGVIANGQGEEGNAALQRTADDTGATIIAGEVFTQAGAHYNQARVFRPETQPLAYNKRHMLPPFEDALTPGATTLTFAGAAGLYGVAICKDMDFTPLLRDYGRDAVELMLVPAWDFNVDRAWHGHIAVMRAVEDGFGLVRSARNGYLTVADSRGRILAEERSDAQMPFSALLATVPVEHTPTIYLRLGDWFAWVACALVAASIARVALFR